jgi:hypothetical protein
VVKNEAKRARQSRTAASSGLGSNIVGLPLEPPNVDWSERVLTLRVRLHELMFAWQMAADAAPESEVAPILSAVAVTLHAVHQSVQDGDIALYRDTELDPTIRDQRVRQAIDRLSSIEKAVRKVVGAPARSERARQAAQLERRVSEHLAPTRGVPLTREDLDDLARRFVRHVFGQRNMPITRQLTRKRLLLDPFDEGKVTVVREAFERIPPAPGDRHDSQRFIKAGLKALGFKDGRGKAPRGIFDFEKRQKSADG